MIFFILHLYIIRLEISFHKGCRIYSLFISSSKIQIDVKNHAREIDLKCTNYIKAWLFVW